MCVYNVAEVKRSTLQYLKNSAAEIHRILVENYGDYALCKITCRAWFWRFKNNKFDVENGAQLKFEDKELEALLYTDSWLNH